MSGDLTRLSRFLSYVLRHDPGAVGVELDAGGWVDVDTLLAALAAHGRPIGVDTLRALVAGTDKVRLQLRDGRVRAAQGHSVPVYLGLVPTSPPDVLYHGTVPRFLPGIRAGGLLPGRRGVADRQRPSTVDSGSYLAGMSTAEAEARAMASVHVSYLNWAPASTVDGWAAAPLPLRTASPCPGHQAV